MGQEIRALRLMLKNLLEKHRTIKNILIEIKEFFMTPIKLLKKKNNRGGRKNNPKRAEIIKTLFSFLLL